MERTRSEIILFAMGAFGVWVSIWAVILVNMWLEAASLALTLGAVLAFAFRGDS